MIDRYREQAKAYKGQHFRLLNIWISVYSISRMSWAHPMLTPTEVFKSLADETRVRAMLLIAAQGELCVCELMCALNDSQPKISRHLAQLRSNGLLLDRRQGQWVYYRLNPDLPAWIAQILQMTSEANTAWLQDNIARLQNMHGRPVRETACC